MNYDPAVTCCFTGHRTIPKAEESAIRHRTALAILGFYHKGYRRFIAGGALGFDTVAAEIVLALKEKHADLSLVLALPCADQAARWTAAEKAHYEAIKARADEVICLTPTYFDGCMQARNRYMVDASSACIAYMTRPYSGAGQTVRMAEKAGLPVINVANAKL
jgi:uncharacterized phage-like protein YoqJ